MQISNTWSHYLTRGQYGSICRVGIFLGFVGLATRAEGPHGGVTHRTCGEPNEIELTATHGLLYGPCYGNRQLMPACWEKDPAMRPTFPEIVEYFQAQLAEMPPPGTQLHGGRGSGDSGGSGGRSASVSSAATTVALVGGNYLAREGSAVPGPMVSLATVHSNPYPAPSEYSGVGWARPAPTPTPRAQARAQAPYTVAAPNGGGGAGQAPYLVATPDGAQAPYTVAGASGVQAPYTVAGAGGQAPVPPFSYDVAVGSRSVENY